MVLNLIAGCLLYSEKKSAAYNQLANERIKLVDGFYQLVKKIAQLASGEKARGLYKKKTFKDYRLSKVNSVQLQEI